MQSLLPIQSLLPLQGMVVILRFMQKTQLNFFHQVALSTFLRDLMGNRDDFNQSIRFDACESGRVDYAEGDLYRFSVYGFKGCELVLQSLILALIKLPDSALDDESLFFGKNCELVCITDIFSEQVLFDVEKNINSVGESLFHYQWQDLLAETVLWQQQQKFCLHFHSPIRLSKEKLVRTKLKGEDRYCRQKSDLSASLVMSRLYDYFKDLLGRRGQTNLMSRPVFFGLNLVESSHLFWLDSAYINKKKPNKPMPVGGMAGDLWLQCDAESNMDWLLLVLAQYSGFGQRTAFGWGRYQLQTLNGELSCRRVFPCASILVKVGGNANFISAYAHVDKNSTSPLPADSIDDADVLLSGLNKDLTLLLKGQYKVPKLQGIIIDKADGGYRALAVPPFRDRVLQRAVAQVLHQLLEKIQSQHSYGFRPGRSRITAKYAIQSAWREGYRWVFESDIDDFFDSVCWQRLAVRLHALWGDDPIVNALLNWMKADVDYQGRSISRHQGLPQGSPLSPLLANIMLDDFDNDMAAAGFRVIRYADDFVVMCKTAEQAENARQAAEYSLQEHGLALDKAKTKITEIDRGFHYLGYLFVNDLVLESPARLRQQDKVLPVASAHSWLAKVGARQLSEISAPDDNIKLVVENSPAHEYGRRVGHGLFLCVTGRHCALSTCNERLQVHRDDKSVYDVPWRHLQAVLLVGLHHLTTPALKAAMQFGVPIHFSSMTGKYEGVIWQGEPAVRGYSLWLKQQAVCVDKNKALIVAKGLVNSRLCHLKESLRLRAYHLSVNKINKLIVKIPHAESIAILNGYEGSATRLYFSAVVDCLPDKFKFSGRNRRPPLDPYNSLLSLGYSMLYSCVESIIRLDGLLPWQGVYHQPKGRHAALASDFMEPFRHVVERLALSLLLRKQLKLEDFYYNSEGACLLNDKARGIFLDKLMFKFDTPLKAKSTVQAQTLFEHIHEQNLSFIRWLESGEDFSAWLLR